MVDSHAGTKPSEASQEGAGGPASGGFPATHWTCIFNAQREDSTLGFEALTLLCQTYWYPLYCYVRRQGFSAPDAQDLTQGFFAHLIEKKGLTGVDRDKGLFRSYLLGAMKHFMANYWRRENAAKRGGGRHPVSIEQELAEKRYANEPVERYTPEDLYDRHWALTVLREVHADLERDYAGKGKHRQFDVLSQFLSWNSGDQTYEEAGEILGESIASVKVQVHRMRKRYRALLTEHIARTVIGEDAVEQELQHLLQALG